MGVNFKDFEDLTPERRVEALQKVVADLQKKIKSDEKDLTQARELLTLADRESKIVEEERVLRSLPVTAPTIDDKTTHTNDPNVLESLIITAPQQQETPISQQPIVAIYGELRSIYEEQRAGNISPEQREKLYAISQEMQRREESGYSPTTDEARHKLTAVQELLSQTAYKGEIKRDYRST